jgi:ferredoxin-NADP reductase/nitrite reductase/ring-hydroxylating ferredoxin subunit
MTDPSALWHPVATSLDLPNRHIFHGQLLGREVAIWRADDNFVNVWENRCLHRGVRLSIGTNDGNELTCRYHGWRYANRSAGCTYIPAHPADAPARTICNRTFPAVEQYGLVWSGNDPTGEPPSISVLDAGTPFTLRNLPVNAPAHVVLDQLRSHHFQPTRTLHGGNTEMTVVEVSDFAISVTSTSASASSAAVFFVQPVDSDRSVIRAVLAETPADAEQLAVLRHHAAALGKVVATSEAAAAQLPAPEPMVATINQVSLALSVMPERAVDRLAPLRVQVARKWETAHDIMAFELMSTGDPLPTFQPGAHIDVHLPNGLVRQYSITNGPGDTACYRIGVKLEAESTGGSQALHHTVRQGDMLAISEPRNNFPLRRDALRTILIAGGIGVTPLLAMAQALQPMKLGFELHYFAQAEEHLAFDQIRNGLGDAVTVHLGLSPDETASELRRLLDGFDHANQAYICGPGPMLEAARAIAADAGWPDQAVHFEYFKNTTEIDDSSSFEIALARSAVTLSVPSGTTILQVLRDHGIAMPSSCEQGACGTCVVPVIEGEIDHQDVHLKQSERDTGEQIMTCVSRAAGDRLVLDI